MSPSTDFKSVASAYSAIAPVVFLFYLKLLLSRIVSLKKGEVSVNILLFLPELFFDARPGGVKMNKRTGQATANGGVFDG